MGLNINRELTMARELTRSKRKLSVTPLRCRDRRLVHRPYRAESLGGGQCDENSNWRIVRGSPRSDPHDGRTRAQRRGVVREIVVPGAPEHFDYLGPDGARRRIQSAWDGPGGGTAIQPIAGVLPCGGHAYAYFGL